MMIKYEYVKPDVSFPIIFSLFRFYNPSFI